MVWQEHSGSQKLAVYPKAQFELRQKFVKSKDMQYPALRNLICLIIAFSPY